MEANYDTRLMELAEKFARAEWRRVMAVDAFDWDKKYLTETDKKIRIENMIPIAKLALEFGANNYREGYNTGYTDGTYAGSGQDNDAEKNLIIEGLVPKNKADGATGN